MAYYFVADVHLGLSYRHQDPSVRERRFVAWLESIEADCEGLFLVGDIFDFWFEYKRVIPKGFVRTLAVLARFCDKGIPVHFFPGNHDLWVRDYFEREIGMRVHRQPTRFELQGKHVFVAHGDGLGKKDWQYAVLRRLFHSRTLRRLFSMFVHPDSALRFGHWWSSGNRHGRHGAAHTFREEREPIIAYAREYLAQHPDTDYLVCGHIHTAADYPLCEKCRVVILGHWIDGTPAAVGRMENGEIKLIEV